MAVSVAVPMAPVAPLWPRLLALEAASRYLSLSVYTTREVAASARVFVAVAPDRRGRRADGLLRRLLYDREALDRLVEEWHATPEAATEPARMPCPGR